MSDLSERLKNLTPHQQKLLKLRMKKKSTGTKKANGLFEGEQLRKASPGKHKIDLSLYFFSAKGTADGLGKYDGMLEQVAFADAHQFKAVWSPERHFQAFGGLFPNPSVLNAAFAARTKNLRLRAGSVVLPLHSPVRIAEEWGVVDNLSGGRVDISFATGWHEADYVIRPENFHNRRELMFQGIETLKKLWRGETVIMKGPDDKDIEVLTLPRPIQPELNCWVTAASPVTWIHAGESGLNVLAAVATNLDDLEQHIKNYREARMRNGHDPRKGIVTLMLHTYLDDDLDRAKKMCRGPLTGYLTNYLNQMKHMPGAEQLEGNVEDMLSFAYERYFNSGSLLGTPGLCRERLGIFHDLGVNEIACLIDFGLEDEDVNRSLHKLGELVPDFL